MGIKNLAFYSKILQLDDFKDKDARFLARCVGHLTKFNTIRSSMMTIFTKRSYPGAH